MLGYLSAIQKENEETTQKAANLMTTVLHAPEVIPVLQEFYHNNTKKFFDNSKKSGRKAQLAFLALEGLFFLKFLGLKKITKKEWYTIIEDARSLILK